MHLLFVCTGNTCRSPLAEAIATAMVRARGLHDIDVSSAGVGAWDGAAASDGSLLVALEQGLDLSTHRARIVTHELVDATDVIFAMSPSHLDRLLAFGGAGKTHLLTEYASRGEDRAGVMDPFGSELGVYRETYEQLHHAIERALDRLSVDVRPESA